MSRIPYILNSYVGSANYGTLSGTITSSATTINVSGTTTNWGNLGQVAGFFLSLNYGNSGEEKVYCPSGIYSWGSPIVTITGISRGQDNTTPQNQQNGYSVVHILTATDLTEANQLVSDVWGGGNLTASGQLIVTSGINSTRITKRVLLISGSSSGTPAYSTDLYDVLHIEYQTAAITSFTTSGTGTPVDGDTFRISVMSTVSGIPLTFGTNFEASTTALPTTTISGVRLDMGFFWNTETNKWRLMAAG
jgi:hypothetical protein